MSTTKFMEAWTKLVAAAESGNTSEYEKLYTAAADAWAEIPEEAQKSLQTTIFTFTRPGAPKPEHRVGDVTMGPACKEPGCTGRLRREVTDRREVRGRPITICRITCTVCGERAFDERVEPKGTARVLVAVLLHMKHTQPDSGELRYNRDEFADTLNYDLRMGQREGGEIAVWISSREAPFQPGTAKPARKD